MNLKVIDIMEDVLIVGGVAISLQQLYTIFGIILLAIQICLIVVKGVIKVYNHIKNKRYEEAVKDIEETQEEIKNISGNKDNGKQ